MCRYAIIFFLNLSAFSNTFVSIPICCGRSTGTYHHHLKQSHFHDTKKKKKKFNCFNTFVTTMKIIIFRCIDMFLISFYWFRVQSYVSRVSLSLKIKYANKLLYVATLKRTLKYWSKLLFWQHWYFVTQGRASRRSFLTH